MTSDSFAAAVEEIAARDPRFEADAYLFVRDALDFTAKQHRKKKAEVSGAPVEHHVTGQQLLDGVRLYALKQYGPMVPSVFEHWRITRCEDIGAIVFNLIEARLFGKTDRDTIEDFRTGYDFHEAFVEPFRRSSAPQQTSGPLANAQRQASTGGEEA